MKKEFNEYKQQQEKQKLIDEITGIEKQRKNITKAKSTPKTKQKPKKIRTFDDYFLECIKIRRFQETHQLTSKKALERAMREYQVGIKYEKSALDNFAEKYIIDGKLKIIPIDYFGEQAPRLKEFVRNIKIKMIMVCLMEQ